MGSAGGMKGRKLGCVVGSVRGGVEEGPVVVSTDGVNRDGEDINDVVVHVFWGMVCEGALRGRDWGGAIGRHGW
jgi:hypothetical protein